MNDRAASEEQPSSFESSFSRAPIATLLALIVVINWFVSFGISTHFGGNALGVRPATEGFVVKSHGKTTNVTERVWRFNLIYPYCTLMLSPAIILFFAARQKALRKVAVPIKWLIIGFVCLWLLVFYGSITKSFMRSMDDYRSLKRHQQDAAANRAFPAAAALAC